MHMRVENGVPILEITEGEANELKIRPDIRTADVRMVIKRDGATEADVLNDVLAGQTAPVQQSSNRNAITDLVDAVKKHPTATAVAAALAIGYAVATLLG